MQFENLYHDEHTLTIKSIDGKVRKNFFPHRMMHVLSSPSFADCVTWREDGNAFVFLDKDKFVEKLAMIPAESPGKKKSFTRKLNRWGFKMDLRKGPNHGMYSHPLFQRDKPWLCEMMICEKNYKSSKAALDQEIDTAEQPLKKIKVSQEEMAEVRNEAAPLASVESYDMLLLDYKILLTEYLIHEKLHSMRMRGLWDENKFRRCIDMYAPIETPHFYEPIESFSQKRKYGAIA